MHRSCTLGTSGRISLLALLNALDLASEQPGGLYPGIGLYKSGEYRYQILIPKQERLNETKPLLSPNTNCTFHSIARHRTEYYFPLRRNR